jgi:acyl-CoA dehydrogenase
VQVNTIWEGSDNILSPDVRPGIERTQVHEPLLECLLRCRIDHLEVAITAWRKLRRAVAEARLFLRARFIGDGFAGAVLIGQAAWERTAGELTVMLSSQSCTLCVTSLTRDPFAELTPRVNTRTNDRPNCSKARW